MLGYKIATSNVLVAMPLRKLPDVQEALRQPQGVDHARNVTSEGRGMGLTW